MYRAIKFVALLLCFVVAAAVGCKKDKPKTLPVITTATVTGITITSAKGGGTITSDGNAEITAKGLVYSNVVATPTVADEKTVVSAVGNMFESNLENLSSGTTYYVR